MKVRIREEHVYSCSILHSSIPALCVIPQIWPHNLTHIHLVINRETWHSLHLQATSIHYTQNKVTFSHFFFLCCFSETLAAEPVQGKSQKDDTREVVQDQCSPPRAEQQLHGLARLAEL